MDAGLSGERLQFLLKRLRERLWVKPVAIALLSIAGAFVAKLADGTDLARVVPQITLESIETLLSIMAASMLVIATFTVASMVSAYASAGTAATPRSFTLVIADDASQNALSAFIGAFIFSLVALVAVKNGFFGTAGRFTLFTLTMLVFALVILTFVRWVDRIARLGRLGTTIDRVEEATAQALLRRRCAPTLHGLPAQPEATRGEAVFARQVGYVQQIEMATLQAWVEQAEGHVVVAALPGTFAAPGRPLAHIITRSGVLSDRDRKCVADAFLIGDDRVFEDDPRFGLVVLAEIAGRALSPAVNDPGTAIDIVGTLVRLFTNWHAASPTGNTATKHSGVSVPQISVRDMFDDAFTAIARDGAGTVEVAVRLQKALHSLTLLDDAAISEAARHHAHLALARAERALQMPQDLAMVRDAARAMYGGSAP